MCMLMLNRSGRTWLEHAVEIDQSDKADQGVSETGLMLVLRLKTAQTSFWNTCWERHVSGSLRVGKAA
jgi:hypothetical protein